MFALNSRKGNVRAEKTAEPRPCLGTSVGRCQLRLRSDGQRDRRARRRCDSGRKRGRAGGKGVIAGGGLTAGGEMGNSHGGTAGSVPSGFSGAGGSGGSPLATGGIASSGGSSAGVSGLASAGETAGISFANPVEYPTGDSPRSLALADLNADGQLDMVVANWIGGSVSVLLGRGQRHIRPQGRSGDRGQGQLGGCR